MQCSTCHWTQTLAHLHFCWWTGRGQRVQAADRQAGEMKILGFCLSDGSLEEQWIYKILYCFHKTVLHLFWDWGNQGLSFRRPDYAIKSGCPDHALPCKPERTRQDSTPLLMSHLRNQSHSIFPLSCIKHILSSPNVPILKIVTVTIKEWFGFFCTLQIISDT